MKNINLSVISDYFYNEFSLILLESEIKDIVDVVLANVEMENPLDEFADNLASRQKDIPADIKAICGNLWAIVDIDKPVKEIGESA